MDIERTLYDKLHQRFPVNRLVTYLKEEVDNSYPLTIHSKRFIEEFSSIEELNPYYAKNIVKVLTDNLHLFNEEEIIDIKSINVIPDDELYLSEWLYEKYVKLLKVTKPDPTATDIIQYKFNEDIKIKIEETPYIISAAGTTGFRTWEAALFLTQYIIDNNLSDELSMENVLELGAGTGMVSIGLFKKYFNKINTLYVTDGDSQLIEGQLSKNFKLNLISKNEKIKLQKLWWNVDSVPNNLNLVIAADVTYDYSVIPDLCQSITDCFKYSNDKKMVCLLAATVRNVETLILFEQKCNERSLEWEIISTTETDKIHEEVLVKNLLFKPLIAPIRIYKITR